MMIGIIGKRLQATVLSPGTVSVQGSLGEDRRAGLQMCHEGS